MRNTMKKYELSTMINNLLVSNELPYRIIRSENENTYMAGLVMDTKMKDTRIMVIEITIPALDAYQYAIKCYDVEDGDSLANDSLKTYLTAIDKSVSLPDGIRVDIGKDGKIVFEITRDIGMPCTGEDIAADINRIADACMHNTLKIIDLIIQSLYTSKVCDPDLSFIRDLTDTVFYSTDSNRDFFPSSITSPIVNEIISDMNLKHKMEVFRSLPDGTHISRCYPNDEKAKANYIFGLLKAEIILGEFAYSNGIEPHYTNILISVLRRMEIAKQTQLDLICNYINAQSVNDEVKQGLLWFYRSMCNEEDRAFFIFDDLGLLNYLSEGTGDSKKHRYSITMDNPFYRNL